MSICRPGTLVKVHLVGEEFHGAKCKRWSCDACRPVKRRQLIAEALAGRPNMLITLTLQAATNAEPVAAARLLSKALRELTRRIRQRFPAREFAALRVTEATKIGTPHFHLLARAPYIPQRWLSKQWQELTGSPIVDIRRLRGRPQAAAYVAKYVGKEPAQFGTMRRWSKTKNYRLAPRFRKPQLRPHEHWWHDRSRSPAMLAGWRRDMGWRVEMIEPGRYDCFRPPPAQGAR